MTPQARHFRLGLFVLGGFAVAIGFVLAFGAGNWLRPKVLIETYFDESVQGIDIGTNVKYRGVTIGQVSHIGFTYSVYEQDKPPGLRRQYVMVESVLSPEELTGQSRTLDEELVGTMIKNGLRVQMAAQGITGIYYLELDYVDPRFNPPLPIDWQPDSLYIPSAPSAVGQIVSGAENLMRKLDQANLSEVVVNLNALMTTLNGTLQQLQTDRLGNQAVALLGELRETNRELQSVVGDPAWRTLPKEASSTFAAARKLVENEGLATSIARLGRTLEHLDRAAVRLDRALVGPERDLPVILDNLRQTAANLRDLTDTLRRSPSTVIFSDPPRPLPRPAPTPGR